MSAADLPGLRRAVDMARCVEEEYLRADGVNNAATISDFEFGLRAEIARIEAQIAPKAEAQVAPNGNSSTNGLPSPASSASLVERLDTPGSRPLD